MTLSISRSEETIESVGAVDRLYAILETGIFPDGKPEWRWMAEVLEGGWKERGACWATDDELYFPTRETSLSAVAGKEVCNGCPVRLSCFTYAIFTNQQLGTWGGESPEIRRKVRRELGLIGT